jgi:hypothetical protein
MVSLVAVIAILAGIIKVFQIGSTLNEMKDLLGEIRRNTQDYSPSGVASRAGSPMRSADALLHASSALESEL